MNIPRRNNLLLSSAFLILASMPAHAVIIASDSFAITQGGVDYNIGDLRNQTATVGTTGYTGAWNAGTAAMQVAAGGYTHALSPGTALDGQIIAFTNTGSAQRRLSRAINYTPTTGTYYMSALFRKSITTTDLDMVAGLSPLEGSNINWSASVGTYMGIWNGAFQFSAGGGNFTELVSATNLTINETFFGLMQINYDSAGSDSITVNVYNGSSAQVGSQTFTGLNLDGNIGRYSMGTWDYSPDVGVDEMRFGSTLADVMVVPEPSSLALIAMSGLLLIRRRRD